MFWFCSQLPIHYFSPELVVQMLFLDMFGQMTN